MAFEQDTVWLNSIIAESLKHSRPNISFHVGNVFKERGLQKVATVKDYSTVQSAGELEGKTENQSLQSGSDQFRLP